jgi:hypothetical protein
MFYADLEPYGYGSGGVVLVGVETVGWLSSDHAFQSGAVQEDLVAGLAALLLTHRVNEYRGSHLCEFCAPSLKIIEHAGGSVSIPLPISVDLFGREFALGSAELWVPSLDGKVVYAAPDLIYHYVKEHGYAPPTGFVEAAKRASRSPNGWDAKKEVARRLGPAYEPRGAHKPGEVWVTT